MYTSLLCGLGLGQDNGVKPLDQVSTPLTILLSSLPGSEPPSPGVPGNSHLSLRMPDKPPSTLPLQGSNPRAPPLCILVLIPPPDSSLPLVPKLFSS